MSTTENTPEVADQSSQIAGTNALTPEMVEAIIEMENSAKKSLAMTLAEYQHRVPVSWVMQTYMNQLAVLAVTIAVEEQLSMGETLAFFTQVSENASRTVIGEKFHDVKASIEEAIEELKARLSEQPEAGKEGA